MSLALKEVIRIGEQMLADAGVADAAIDAKELYCYMEGLDRTGLMMAWQRILQDNQCEAYFKLVEERASRVPLQHITGTQEFMGLPFAVNGDVLIPRQDTETLCEEAIALIKRRGYKTCLDLCAGSGCIGISIANICGTEVTLADISEAALSLCRENAEANGVSIRTIKTDMFDKITDKYDIIVCNPPYLTASDMASLQRELTFEPANALYGGVDGLDFYRRIARDYAQRLNDGGALALEVGIHQAEEVAKMLGGARIVKDVCGIERAVIKEW